MYLDFSNWSKGQKPQNNKGFAKAPAVFPVLGVTLNDEDYEETPGPTNDSGYFEPTKEWDKEQGK